MKNNWFLRLVGRISLAIKKRRSEAAVRRLKRAAANLSRKHQKEREKLRK